LFDTLLNRHQGKNFRLFTFLSQILGMPAAVTNICSLQIFQTSPGAHSASYSVVTLVLFRGQSSQGVMMSSHLHLAPTLRMGGATTLLPLYACLLTPWSTVLNEKLISSHIVKKLPTFYRNRMSLTTFTSARHLSL
jgi:hypothetical protein